MLAVQCKKLYNIKNTTLPIINREKYTNKHDKDTKGRLSVLLYAVLLGIIVFILAYMASLAFASFIGFSAANNYMAAQFLQQFGYTNASKALAEIASLDLRVARWSPIIVSLIIASVSAIYGYLKGKNVL